MSEYLYVDCSPAEVICKLHSPSNAGSAYAQFDISRRFLRAKLPAAQLEWFLERAPSRRPLYVSASTFNGKAILPNFASTRLIAVTIDHRTTGQISSPEQLAEMLSWRLTKASVPLFSLIAWTPSHAEVVWVLDEPIEYRDFSVVYQTEHGLSRLLSTAGASKVIKGVSRLIPFPSISDSRDVRLIVPGAIRTVDQYRLYRSVHNSVSLAEADTYSRGALLIHELNSILATRTLQIPTTPESIWRWVACYAAACARFVDQTELRECARSIAESIHNLRWSSLRSAAVQGKAYSYDGLVDVIARNARAGEVSLGIDSADYFAIVDPRWAKEAAARLEITPREICELQLRDFVPNGSPTIETGYFYKPKRVPIGVEDYVSVQRFLLRAA